MKTPPRAWSHAVAAIAALLLVTASCARGPDPTVVPIDPDDIGGIVSGPDGPEAGVWVIAETRDLDVRYIKSVVTDDLGRFVVPDLPDASYRVWARGYGLVDSEAVTARPGAHVALSAQPAATPADAARFYPAIYWYSMLRIPTEAALTSEAGAGRGMTQRDVLAGMKNTGCIGCHQLGQASTRTLPPGLGTFESSEEAWTRRIQSGQAGALMAAQLGRLGPAATRAFAEWTDRIAAGELPHAQPARPQGVERNVVVTLRDWMTDRQYLHDLIASDRRVPTVNANGPLYGSPEYSSDLMPILDPVANTATTFRLPVRDADMPLSLGPGHAAAATLLAPSPYWGDEVLWDTRANNHNSMFGRDGKLWLAATVRAPDNPAFCQAGSDHPSARVFPLERSMRQLAVFDPATREYRFVDTCFGTHHLQFGYDDRDTLWTSGGGPVVGWLDSHTFLETGDAERAQGWTPLVLDTNGNGRRDAWVEPDATPDPAKDTRVNAGFYAVMPSPVDGSVWGSSMGVPGRIVRLAPGDDPSTTALAEVFNVPAPGFAVRGADIDSQGVVWVSLGSGHLGSFDRRKCTAPLSGPTATGDHCPEGWTFHQYPGPGFQGLGDNSAESSYYTWVDQHDTFGLGRDVPMSTGNLNDGLIAFSGGAMVVLRVPYPLGFYAKGFDGRIDDAAAGWKGRGLWAANGDRTPWLIEGGKGSKPLAAHFQLRPDPLAK
ncbi:MAG: carboxypeptidase regulatory-like domain-containing protein [Vicinamibacterales bacterium]